MSRWAPEALVGMACAPLLTLGVLVAESAAGVAAQRS